MWTRTAALLTVWLSTVAIADGVETSANPTQSLADYTPAECDGVLAVEPPKVVGTLLASLPWEYVASDTRFSAERLGNLGVEGLAVFANHSAASEDADLALAVKFCDAVSLPSMLKNWKASLVDGQVARSRPPYQLEIDGHVCFQIEAGTFFPAPCDYGTLRFLNRRGQPAERGISVGDMDAYRQYVEGETHARAIFTFSNVDASAFVDKHLPFSLTARIFQTYNIGSPLLVQVRLQNPETQRSSQPIVLTVESYRPFLFRMPRTHRSSDGKTADLIRDFTHNGKLEIVIEGLQRAIYVGVGQRDLCLLKGRHEFIHVKGNRLLVAQSQSRLQQMLAQDGRQSVVASQLRKSNSPIFIYGETAHRERAASLIRQLAPHSSVRQMLNDRLQMLTLSITEKPVDDRASAGQVRTEKPVDDRASAGQVRANKPVDDRASAGQVRANKPVDDRASAGQVRTEKPVGAKLKLRYRSNADVRGAVRTLAVGLGSLRVAAIGQIEQFIAKGDLGGQLTRVATNGLPVVFPFPHEKEEPTRKVLNEQLNTFLQGVKFTVDGSQVEIAATLPQLIKESGKLPESSEATLLRHGIAWLEHQHATSQFIFKRFDLGYATQLRAARRLPEHAGYQARVAHQFAFNTLAEMDSVAQRYPWLHQGVATMLDRALAGRAKSIRETAIQNDLYWMAAYVMHRKFATADERHGLQRLFLDDKNLHAKLKRIIDLDDCKDASNQLDPVIAAWQLLQFAESQMRSNSTIPHVTRVIQPALQAAQVAAHLDTKGQGLMAKQYWARAEHELKQASKASIKIDKHEGAIGEVARLELAAGQEPTPRQKELLHVRNVIHYDSALARAQLEQSSHWREARVKEAAAKKEKEPTVQLDRIREAITALDASRKAHPDDFAKTAHAHHGLIKQYKLLVEGLGQRTDANLATIVERIESTPQPASAYLFMDESDLWSRRDGGQQP